jgi:DNA-binding beta-propeller fold protein YncE
MREFLRPPMYWVNTNTGMLYRLIDETVELFVPGARNVTSLAVDVTNDKVYWTEKTSDTTGKVRRANFDGTNVEDVKSLTGIPHDIAINATGRKIYWTNSQGKIQRFNTDGSNFQPNLITGLMNPKSIALDGTGRKIYWTEDVGRIRQANLDGSNIQNFATDLGTIGDIVVAGDRLYWTESQNKYDGRIKRAFLSGGKVESFGSFFRSLVGIDVDTAENRIYWTNVLGQIQRAYLPGLSGEMLRPYIALGSIQTIVIGLDTPGGLALGKNISSTPVTELQHPAMYWTDKTNGTLHRSTGATVENLLPSVQNVTSLTMDVAGSKLYWTEKTGHRTGKIQRANLDGSNVQLVKSLTSVPRGIAIDPANGKLYLTNSWGKIQRLSFDGSGFEPNLLDREDGP